MTCLHNHDQILEFLRKIFLKGFQIYQNYLCALTKLNKIDKNLILTCMSQILLFFFLLAIYSQRASTRITYFIHRIILVCDKIAQIHIIHSANLLWHHCCAVERLLCNAMIRCTISSHRLAHNQFTRCYTILAMTLWCKRDALILIYEVPNLSPTCS